MMTGAHGHTGRAPGREETRWTLTRWWIRSIALLRQRGRVTYRALKRQFTLDDEALDDLKDELL